MHALLRSAPQTLFPPALMWMRPANSILPRVSGIMLCPLLWAYRYSWQVSTRLRGRIALVFQSPSEICHQISQHRDWADEGVRLVFHSAMDLCFLGCLLDEAQLLWIVLELVPRLCALPVKSLKIPAARRPAIHKPHLSYIFHCCYCTFVTTLLRPFSWLFLNLPVRKWALCHRFRFLELTFWRMPTVTK